MPTSPTNCAAPPTPALLWGVERTKGALFRVNGNAFRVGGAPVQGAR